MKTYDTGHGTDCCELCGGELGILGQLGSMIHLQCRDCGIGCARPDEREPEPCAECAHYRELGFGPSHDGSPRCRMGASPASGGNTPHCTCNACF